MDGTRGPVRTGAQGVAEVIARLDSPIVFGIPGGNTMFIFDGLRDRTDDVDCVLVREESLGTIMAEAYGRLAGRPAVVMGQGAWILGVGGIGLIEAQLGASPVVALLDLSEGGTYSHHGIYQSGGGGYGAYELIDAVKAVTKRTFFAEDPVQAVQMTQLAFKHATSGEPGPVAVVFHSRALVGPLEGEDLDRVHFDLSYTSPIPVASPAAVELAASALRRAVRPVVIAGNGCRGAADALADFAARLGVPVVATTSGKGILPETSVLSGGVMGAYGHNTANALVARADLIIAVGTKLSASDTMDETPELVDPRRQTIVQIDVDPLNVGWTLPVDVGVLGDASDVLPRIADAVPGYSGEGASRVRAVREEFGYFDVLPVGEVAGRVSPRRLARILSETLPAESVIACDAGENRIFMLHDFQTRGQIVIAPNGAGGMGYAIPAATAASFVHPDRTAVAVVGDGGFGMSIHGLMSAVDNQRRLIVVVMDNGALGWVLHGQGDRGFLYKFTEFDYTKLAESLNCLGFAAESEDEVRSAVAAALDHDGVSVVIVKTDLVDDYRSIATDLASDQAAASQPDSHQL